MMKSQFIKLTCTFCLSVVSWGLFAQSPYVLSSSEDHWGLDEDVEILPDSGGILTFERVSQDFADEFIPISKFKNPQSINYDHIWLKIVLLNQNKSEKFILTTDIWDEVKAYFYDSLGNLHVKKIGNAYPISKREENLGRFLHLPLYLQPNRATVVYLKMSQITEDTKSLNNTYNFFKRLELKTYSEAWSAFFVRSLFYAFNAGVLMIIIVYKLVIFIYIRDIAYLFFSIFLSGLLASLSVESGLVGHYLMPDRPDESFAYLGIFLSVSWIALVLFARSYLRLSEFSPKLSRLVIILAIAQVFILLLALLGYSLGILSFLVFTLVIFSMLYISIRSIMTGFKPARYFLLADSMFLLASILNIFTATGVIPYDFYIEPYNIGNLLQVTLFSLGLAYRFKVMQIEVKTHKEEKQKMIERQKEELELEVKRQTEHIQSQKEEIQVQNEELYQQREEIAAQRDYVENKNKELEIINSKLQANELILKKANDKLSESQQKISLKNLELEERNRQIRSSINAALSIQTAILPYPYRMKEILGDYFVIYKPKDVVSGDFYWIQEVNNCRIIVAADCTGHGVPGALMSMIGNTVLDKVITMQCNTDPSKILEEVHKEVQFALKQEETKNNNGMDMSVLVLHEYQKGLTLARYAGAKNSMYFRYPREKEVIEVKGSRRAIGGHQNIHIPFETREIIFSPGTLIYMGSDGYVDQNNSARKRLGEKAFRKILCQIASEPLDKQKLILEEELKNHMQNTQQRDDILLMGFKI
ncbi:MAG: 7TM diverse intracellular signaling domain-containing protein [Microscillaceae bacterium]|nr:7TM diverse intracellular signaling domain-containing protein [Microscillaceae bacterium]